MTTTLESLSSAIREASASRDPQMQRTPLVHSPALSDLLGCRVLLKLEHLQTTGSFKYRGASNKVRLLSDADRGAGVVTASSGNHGQALALAAQNAGVPVRVFASKAASPTKLAAIRGYGAELELVDGSSYDAELAALRAAKEAGLTYVSPYNDLDIIAGQGTLGLELLEPGERLDAVFLSVGGGGLAAGVGTALHSESPTTELIGCWPANSPALLRALELGYVHDVAESQTLSDGTAGGVEEDAITLPICSKVMGRKVAVSEAEIAAAMRTLADTERWMVEGAAGVALAGLANLREEMRGKTVAIVLCGRNISAAKFSEVLTNAGSL
ncbi:threonine/serine dehydratase [Stenotrophomonas sp. Ste96]|uniref:threonine/serine dehydratase n=1 Tax=Stenotrophomonas sp. Ste96 TaxID=2926029 RepID=UPI0021C6B46E|nr:threonine/serine dehydratase [Stenotrophomonas sp. Ste96]